MRFPRKLTLAATLLAASGAATSAVAQTEIHWWHAMGGALGERVADIAAGFNAKQSDYKVVPTYKGNYTENMTAGIAAFRSGKQPHILQVFEVGTATMMSAKGAIKPVYELMAEAGEAFDPKAYLSTVTGYYTDPEGNMLSMPFNSSTPVLYYNKEAFEKAGLDPNIPPKTWPELAEVVKKTQAAGYPCGLTTAWQSWVQLENFSAW
ncbi:MAG: extracellular solute-binding protein, partial [Kiloniellales bacterium]|nr:extracellular solute-binding protein [Kiloniellales bacterium]